jgi:flagellar biosynthetic protein flhB
MVDCLIAEREKNRKEGGMHSEYLTEEEVEKIKKELLQVLRNHNLNSGLAKVVLIVTVETIEKYSQLPE